MKKFLSLTVALAMTLAMVPSTAFAKSEMKISKVITAETNDLIYKGAPIEGIKKTPRDAPILTLKADGGFKNTVQTFRLKLTNAEWINEKDSTGKLINFENEANNNGAISVIDVSTGASLVGGGSTVNDKEAARKALQSKLDSLTGTSETSGVSIESEEVINIVNALMASGKGAADLNDPAKVRTAMTSFLPADVVAVIGVSGSDSDEAWKSLEKSIVKYVAQVAVVDAADNALELDAAKGTTSKVALLEEAIEGFNKAVKVDAYSLESITAMMDIAIANSKSLAAASVAVKLQIVDTIGNNPLELGSLHTAMDDYLAIYYNKGSEEKILATIVSNIEFDVKQFNKINVGSGPAVGLVADEVLAKYKATSDDPLEFKIWLQQNGIDPKHYGDLKVLLDRYALADGIVTPGKGGVEVVRVTDSLVMITITPSATLPDDAEINIPLYTKITGGEQATVEVDPRDSELSSDSKTFVRVSEGSTTSFVDTTKNFYDGDTLNTIYIDENAAGTFEVGKIVNLKLSSGFKWGDSTLGLNGDNIDKIKMLNAGGLTIKAGSIKVDGNELTFELAGTRSVNPATISLNRMVIKDDGADFGTTAKVTVSGAGITKTLVELGTYSDFGLSLTAESKALPLIYAGSFDTDNETLRVTFEETVQSSWLTDRKTEFTLPDGVKFVDVEVKKFENTNKSAADLEAMLQTNIDGSTTTIDARSLKVTDGKKAKFEAIFTVTANPTFTGDVELTAGGPGVGGEKLTKAIATVASPLTVKSTVNEVKIDYRNVDVNSITITEAEAGLWEKGDYITLAVEEMQFESGIKAEIISGDMKLEKLDGDNISINKKAGTVTIQVKSTSSATPAEIKIDGIKLFLDRTLPTGTYALSVVGTDYQNNDHWPIAKEVGGKTNKEKDLLFANFRNDAKDWEGNKHLKAAFDITEVEVLTDFVDVVTAGRDQGDGFTTKLVVPVGSDKIMAGTTEITIDAPAYINADGYTMLPVRAVIDALNGIAIVRWDDASKTCTISYANKVFAMTVGSKTMNMNGVSTPLLAAPEIKSERIFLPLRDLGYALGLTDSKIAWDAATNTATLN